MNVLAVSKANNVRNVSKINRYIVISRINSTKLVAKHLYGSFSTSSVPSNALLAEDGTPILNEDGSYILIE